MSGNDEEALFADISIELWDGENKSPKVITTGVQGLRLEKGRIYTLQGPNGAGKSSLIRAVMAVPQGAQHKGITLRVAGKQTTLRDVHDALGHGLVSVFQDDDLIPTMTVREQILLRHCRRGFRTIILDSINRLLRKASRFFGKELFRFLSVAKTDEDQLLEKASQILAQFDSFSGATSNYGTILNKYPRHLSGGEKAVARILLGQLTNNIRILFLDEVFRGVQREVWPRLIDAIRAWACDSGVSVLAVSHSDAELARWRPGGRFEMRHRKLNTLPPIKYECLYQGIPARDSVCAVFDPVKHPDWCNELGLRGPWLLFVDKSVSDLTGYRRVKEGLVGSVIVEEVVTADAGIKALDSVRSMLFKLTDKENSAGSLRKACVFIAGGGTLINWASFIASIFHRGVPTVIFPTTVMAMADVALGSKTSIDIIGEDDKLSLKHVLGTYHNPRAIIIDCSILETLSVDERRLGLSECLKHGLLQDSALWFDALRLFLQAEPPYESCCDIARKTMGLKAHVMSLDPWERSFGRILLYGHLHAHSLERLLGLNVSHGRAVLFGMLIDLRLSDNNTEYEMLLKACKETRIFLDADMKRSLSMTQDEWRRAYFSDPKEQHVIDDQITYLAFEKVACFADPRPDFEETYVKRKEWRQFWPILDSTLKAISS
ncbi:MAG: ATP-binding cassette domain-containing protein [Defluviicoccus sp.]|nr:ATP-binding cassette domain-containing protein [Defluviicoccus sp.]